MPNDKRHVGQIDQRLHILQGAYADFGNTDFDELFKIIHFPGWTTPAEFFLINSLLDPTEGALKTVIDLHGALVKGAMAIAEESKVGV